MHQLAILQVDHSCLQILRPKANLPPTVCKRALLGGGSTVALVHAEEALSETSWLGCKHWLGCRHTEQMMKQGCNQMGKSVAFQQDWWQEMILAINRTSWLQVGDSLHEDWWQARRLSHKRLQRSAWGWPAGFQTCLMVGPRTLMVGPRHAQSLGPDGQPRHLGRWHANAVMVGPRTLMVECLGHRHANA